MIVIITNHYEIPQFEKKVTSSFFDSEGVLQLIEVELTNR